MTDFRSGFVAVVGRPNVGKSTLVNALVGEKISIVTAKPQTTRHAIVAVLNADAFQVVFIDTPGIHSGSKKLMNRTMNKAASNSLADADLVLLLVEAGRWTDEDQAVLEQIIQSGRRCMLVVNKVDRIKPREALLPFLAECGQRHEFAEIVPVSALKNSNLDRLQSLLGETLPVQEAFYDSGTVTDRSMEFRVAEMLREKLMEALHEEVPYGVGVEVNKLESSDRRVLVDIVIWVDRVSHKGIVVGKDGERLKKVGRQARLELEQIFKRSFHLQTHVKARENWSDNAQALRQMGYDERY
ncbi:MAG: GTPase Era [Gammaproteobacteria bacterium]